MSEGEAENKRKRGRIYSEKGIKKEKKKSAKTTWQEEDTSCTSLIYG